jgi:hypothetical protein
MLGGCFLSGKNKDVWTLLPTDLQGLGLQSYEEDEFFFKRQVCVYRPAAL